MTVCYQWRGEFDNTDVDSLHAEGFDHSRSQGDWWEQVNRHSLGWVCARDFGANLSGFYLDACNFSSTHAGLIAL